jgi:hypothetical protein
LLGEALSDWDTEDLDQLAGLLGRLGEDLLALSEPAEVEA